MKEKDLPEGCVLQNAIIDSVDINDGDRGLLTAYLHLDYGGSFQGFGGYALYLPDSYDHHELNSVAGHFIFRCMQIGGVYNWDKLKGKTVRAVREDDKFQASIIGIGHIVKDDFFLPSIDFKQD